MKRVISILAIACLICAGFAGAQDYVCGDANYDSVANIDDGAFLFDYLVTGGPAPVLPDPAWANWDGHDGLTINDVFACKTFMDSGSYNPVCPVEGPVASQDIYTFYYSGKIPAMADHGAINISIGPGLKAFLLPLQVTIDGVPEAIDSIKVMPKYSTELLVFKGSVIYPDLSTCVLGVCFKNTTVNRGYSASIYISPTPSSGERTATLDWAVLNPLQSPEPTEIITPLVVNYRDSVATPELIEDCCLVPGDANNDGSCDTGDAVFIIAFAFRHTVTPVCFNAADANDDCGVNVGDAVFIIGYCWRGGARPRCGCAE